MRALSLTVPADPAAVGSARRFVLAACDTRSVGTDARDTCVLLTSEVVTNAILHGRSQATLAVSFPAGSVHVEVADDNTRHPVVAEPDPDALDGRGVSLLDLLATAWGVREEVLGKTVWFDVATG